jgi:hypothetical protein
MHGQTHAKTLDIEFDIEFQIMILGSLGIVAWE